MMFLNKKYILANELAQNMKMHIANISNYAKSFGDDDYGHTIKMNNCTFIDTTSLQLPHNFLVGILTNEYVDMSDKLPCTWVKDEYNMTEKEMLKANMIFGKVKVAGKEFYHFLPEFVEQMQRKIGYVMDLKETEECIRLKQIQGSIKLTRNKFFTWY